MDSCGVVYPLTTVIIPNYFTITQFPHAAAVLSTRRFVFAAQEQKRQANTTRDVPGLRSSLVFARISYLTAFW